MVILLAFAHDGNVLEFVHTAAMKTNFGGDLLERFALFGRHSV